MRNDAEEWGSRLPGAPSAAVASVACSNCRHWHKLDGGEGECRCNPPQVAVLAVQTALGQGMAPVPVFPRTRKDIWCGQFAAVLIKLPGT